MSVAVATLKSWISHRPLRSGDESISLGKMTTFDLPHEEVDIRRHHADIFRENNAITVSNLISLFHLFLVYGRESSFELTRVWSFAGVTSEANSIKGIYHTQRPC